MGILVSRQPWTGLRTREGVRERVRKKKWRDVHLYRQGKPAISQDSKPVCFYNVSIAPPHVLFPLGPVKCTKVIYRYIMYYDGVYVWTHPFIYVSAYECAHGRGKKDKNWEETFDSVAFAILSAWRLPQTSAIRSCGELLGSFSGIVWAEEPTDIPEPPQPSPSGRLAFSLLTSRAPEIEKLKRDKRWVREDKK